MSVQFLPSPIGILRITADGRSITHVERVTKKEKGAPDRLTAQCAKELTEYFDGKRTTFTCPINPAGTSFQKTIWARMRKIPYGKSMSYSALAKAVGKPQATRAVGSACGKNPLLILTPCHRVIKSDGTLGGFSAGIEKKRKLQKIESRKK